MTGPGNGRTAVDLGCGAGMETRALDEEHADGPAYGGAKHRHVFHVIAVAP